MIKLITVHAFGVGLTLMGLGSILSASAFAQDVRVHKTTTTTSTVVQESDGVQNDVNTDPSNAKPQQTPRPPEIKESTMTSKFGSKGQSGLSGCKTEEISKETVKDLKSDCKAWIKDQKADLGTRFLTSSCEESCDDCGTSLKRCMVTGTIHYLLK